MIIFDIIKNLYVNKESSWISKIEDTDIQPFVIQRWLTMNDKLRIQVRWLDKYIFSLPPKMYLSLAWSVIPKVKKVPYCKYIKKVDGTEEFDFILSKIRRHFEIADNDYKYLNCRIVEGIKSDMVNWFSYYGIPKKYWKRYYLNFNKIKEFGMKEDKSQKGLSNWGM